MSKKNWLRNLIFEDAEPEKGGQQKSKQATPAPTQTKQTPTPATSTLPKVEKVIMNQTISGKVDQTLLNKLCTALDEQPAEGIDYLKFKKSVDSLKDFQPEENIRFTTAYVTLKATNPKFSKDYLIQTIDKYINLMEQERKVGMQQLKDLRSKDIDKKEKELIDAAKNVEKMKAEIQRLTRFISETEIELNNKRNEFTIREADFNTTVDKIVNQLKNDRTKIDTIIK